MIVFVIPAYNEARNLPTLLANLDRAMRDDEQAYEIILVDDGSTDTTPIVTAEASARFPVCTVRFEQNRGVGAAFRAGFAAALSRAHPGDIVVTKEADNTSDVGVLREMLAQIRGGHDLVLASCYAEGGGIVGTTPLRVALSSVANTLLKLVFPITAVYTYSSFYRAYTYELLERAHQHYGDKLLTEDGFVCMVELLVKLAALRARIAEVPVVVRGDLRGGKSKMKVLRTMRDYARFTLRSWRLWRKTA